MPQAGVCELPQAEHEAKRIIFVGNYEYACMQRDVLLIMSNGLTQLCIMSLTVVMGTVVQDLTCKGSLHHRILEPRVRDGRVSGKVIEQPEDHHNSLHVIVSECAMKSACIQTHKQTENGTEFNISIGTCLKVS